ncbi:Pentatricopeptide repeat-containing protein [Artemisia annua]|uniref:Pentatricopeptide repeat-containing protein n=1 Tax=Artemisia annua TaxID=35608 RepID=A0A2U1PMY5_ARTAN|nr:Pentatricopeptide repeat-containing protein [Artemisia annua]
MLQKTVTTKTLTEKCKTLTQFKQLHAQIIKSHLPDNPIAIGPLLSALATTSSNPPFFSYARSIFENLKFRNTFMYNTMIRGYVMNGENLLAVMCFKDMLKFGFLANGYTFSPLIKACLGSGFVGLERVGISVHGFVLKLGFGDDGFVGSGLIEFYAGKCEMGDGRKVFDEMSVKDVVVWTSLIDGYGKNEDVESARMVFDEMPRKSVVSWSAMMAAYSRVGEFEEVVCLFETMQELGVRPNESVLVSVLTACGNIGALAQGLWVHSYAKRYYLDSNTILATALVDMYSKCGYPDLALSVFKSISVKDTGAWNAIISGLSMNGKARTSLDLLNQMASVKIQPSAATFVAILTACTHANLVKEGVKLFNQMDKSYGVKPQFEHYACVVDLFARAGMLEEAIEFVENRLGGIGKGDANVWGALLGACRTYENVEVGNKVWRKLVEMKVNDYGVCVVSYNMYKEAGWKREAEEVRNMISELGLKKTPGCSAVEVDGVVREFVSGDNTHSMTQEIHKTLDSLVNVARLLELQ